MDEELNYKLASSIIVHKVRKRKVSDDLVYAHFFVVDVVGASDPTLPVKRQKKKIQTLNNLIPSSKIFKSAKKDLIYLPTGDGAVLGFMRGPEHPFMLAMELHEKINEYNKGRFPEERLAIRIGMNHGAAYVVKDAFGKKNFWGPGIILARRVMDIGDDGHILLTPKLAETLWELEERYKVMINALGDYTIKHGQPLLLYSVYGNWNGTMIGNPEAPARHRYQVSSADKYFPIRTHIMNYRKIEVILTITDPQTMLTHYKRIHFIENISDQPIETILLRIATDVPKRFPELKIKTFDESGKELRLTSIKLDKPYHKEFMISFHRPVYKGEKNRGYILEYDVEEPNRYFENFFSINCKEYVMSIIYPSNARFKPVVYDVNVDEETKIKSRIQPTVAEVKKGLVRATWAAAGIKEGQAVRLAW